MGLSDIRSFKKILESRQNLEEYPALALKWINQLLSDSEI